MRKRGRFILLIFLFCLLPFASLFCYFLFFPKEQKINIKKDPLAKLVEIEIKKDIILPSPAKSTVQKKTISRPKTVSALSQDLQAELPKLQETAVALTQEAGIPDPKSPLPAAQDIIVPPPSLPPALINLFQQFDVNKDETLNIDEAVAFY